MDFSRVGLGWGTDAVEPLLQQRKLRHQERGVNSQGGKLLKDLDQVRVSFMLPVFIGMDILVIRHKAIWKLHQNLILKPVINAYSKCKISQRDHAINTYLYDWKPSMLTFARFSSLFLSLSHVAWEASCFNMLTEGGVVMSKKREKAIRREQTGIFSTCSQTFDEPKKTSMPFSVYPNSTWLIIHVSTVASSEYLEELTFLAVSPFWWSGPLVERCGVLLV